MSCDARRSKDLDFYHSGGCGITRREDGPVPQAQGRLTIRVDGSLKPPFDRGGFCFPRWAPDRLPPRTNANALDSLDNSRRPRLSRKPTKRPPRKAPGRPRARRDAGDGPFFTLCSPPRTVQTNSAHRQPSGNALSVDSPGCTSRRCGWKSSGFNRLTCKGRASNVRLGHDGIYNPKKRIRFTEKNCRIG